MPWSAKNDTGPWRFVDQGAFFYLSIGLWTGQFNTMERSKKNEEVP